MFILNKQEIEGAIQRTHSRQNKKYGVDTEPWDYEIRLGSDDYLIPTVIVTFSSGDVEEETIHCRIVKEYSDPERN